MPTHIALLSNASALLMLIGYLWYASFLFRHNTRANATMWTLTSISGVVLIIAEFLYGVPWNALKTDAVDAVAAVLITLIAFGLRSYTPWTERDKKLVIWYIGLFIVYLAGDYLGRNAHMAGFIAQTIQIGVIVLYNITTLIEFWPLLRETWEDPSNELPYAWFVWTSSYSLYFFVRLFEKVELVNLLHPMLAVLLHGSLVLLAIPHTKKLLEKYILIPFPVKSK
jgi:hypothetical protein